MVKIRTVRGDISPEDLGVTLSHEHILINLQFLCNLMMPQEASLRALMDKPVTIEMIYLLRRGVRKFNYDDALLSDIDLMVRELLEYKSFSGRSLVEQTLPGIGRDPLGLKRISELTGLNIICSTGWYIVSSHPSYVKNKSSEELADIMIKEIEEGIDDIGIKAGVIGECGCSFPIPYHPEEEKVLRAACKAQKATGVAFSCHPAFIDVERKVYRTDAPLAYIKLIEKEGANLEKFFLSHSDIVCPTSDHASKLLEKGINLSFDTFGQDHYDDYIFMGARHPTDPERISNIVELCKRGYEKNIMLSQDVCWKHLLKRYGGPGYSHLLEHIVPTFRYYGVKEKQIRTMLIDNPKRILSF
ncbi:MAG: hypothetical protein QXX95_00350 [Nitrososphaerales archaeon]